MKEKEVLDRTQFGFRKGKVEAIYVLTEIIEVNIRKEEGKVYVCFADLKVAFVKLKRKIIWNRLRKIEVREELIEKLEDIKIN